MLALSVILAYFFTPVANGLSLDSNPSIIIIGSGPSGIAAATKLLKNNFTNIKILEAENRIGGRINSIYFGDAYVDMGAQFCHGEEDNIVYSLAKDVGVLRHSTKENHFFYSNGDIIDDRLGAKVLQFAESLESGEKSESFCENITSVGECLDIKFKNFASSAPNIDEKQILTDSSDWINSHLCAFDSTFDLKDLKLTSAYKKCKGDLRMNWNGLGYKTILDIMTQTFPNTSNRLPVDDKIFLNSEVTSVTNWKSGHATIVRTSDGAEYEADHVIFTPSLGVLKANYQRLFHPPLPREKAAAIKNIGFGAIVKIQMHFPKRWWNEDANWLFIWSAKGKRILREKNLEWLVNAAKLLQGEHNPKVLTAWYAGNYVPTIERLSEQEVLDGQNHLINTFFGHHLTVTLPDKFIRSTWYSNAHFRGTYSYESVKGHSTGGSSFPEVLGSPLTNENNKPTVLFAGEATHPRYFSTVHGAIESGFREAERLIQFYKNKT